MKEGKYFYSKELKSQFAFEVHTNVPTYLVLHHVWNMKKDTTERGSYAFDKNINYHMRLYQR